LRSAASLRRDGGAQQRPRPHSAQQSPAINPPPAGTPGRGSGSKYPRI